MTGTYQITRAAELESLAAFRELIKSACSEHPDITGQIGYDLQLAADEACTNIIQHGYAGMNPGSIILDLEFEPGKVFMTITDFGHPFEPSEAPQPDVEAALEDRPTGGFGLFFIYQAMDKVDYKTATDCNQLVLTKYLPSIS